MRFLLILISFISVLKAQEEWALEISSTVELRTLKLTNKAEISSKPVRGAIIKLYQGNAVVKEVRSDARGDFAMLVPPDGDYIIEISHPNCNAKKFAVSTKGIPENYDTRGWEPTFPIGGVIMAKPLYSISYSALQQPMARIYFKQRKKVFEDDEDYTDQVLDKLKQLKENEDDLVARFLKAVNAGDDALKVPDCPLAKAMYEKALKIIPDEAYPIAQLAKVGECLKTLAAQEEKAKAEAEKRADAERVAQEKAEADLKAKEQAATAAKEKAEAAAKQRAEAERMAQEKAEADLKAKEQAAIAAKEKAEAEAAAKQRAEAERMAREKAEADLKAKEQAATVAKEKAEAEAAAKQRTERERMAREKAEADLKAKEQAATAAKEKAEAEAAAKQRAEAERMAREKAEADLKAKEQAATAAKEKAEAEAKQRAETERVAKEKAEADQRKKESSASQTQNKAETSPESTSTEAPDGKSSGDNQQAAGTKAATRRTSVQDKPAVVIKERKTRTRKKRRGRLKSGKASYKTPQVIGKSKYETVVQEADACFDKKDYDSASAKYEEALRLKPDDAHATKRLDEIRRQGPDGDPR